jgi:quercetin dioxygenase-like cupin family protein
MPTAAVPTHTRTPIKAGDQRWFFGGLVEIKATAADTNGEFTLLQIDCPPGLEAPLHRHNVEDEGFYVLSGSVTIDVDGETVELRAGDHAFGPRDLPHRYVVGPDGASMLWILTPGGFEDFVYEVSVPAAAPTVPPPDLMPPANFVEIAAKYGRDVFV